MDTASCLDAVSCSQVPWAQTFAQVSGVPEPLASSIRLGSALHTAPCYQRDAAAALWLLQLIILLREPTHATAIMLRQQQQHLSSPVHHRKKEDMTQLEMAVPIVSSVCCNGAKSSLTTTSQAPISISESMLCIASVGFFHVHLHAQRGQV